MLPLFSLGQIVATPGALAALERAQQAPTCFLVRHASGDWGELEPADVAENRPDYCAPGGGGCKNPQPASRLCSFDAASPRHWRKNGP